MALFDLHVLMPSMILCPYEADTCLLIPWIASCFRSRNQAPTDQQSEAEAPEMMRVDDSWANDRTRGRAGKVDVCCFGEKLGQMTRIAPDHADAAFCYSTTDRVLLQASTGKRPVSTLRGLGVVSEQQP